MFATIEETLPIVRQYCQLEDSTHDLLLIQFLEASKALSLTPNPETLEDVTVYRPFIVCYHFLKLNPLRDGIREAVGTDSVKFQEQSITTEGMLNLQRSLDKTLKKIPSGWGTEEGSKNLHTFSAFVVD